MPYELARRPCTALVRRPCVALVQQWRRLRKVYRCEGCRLWETHCVCGTGVVSLGHKLAAKQEDRFRQRMLGAMIRALLNPRKALPAPSAVRRRRGLVVVEDADT